MVKLRVCLLERRLEISWLLLRNIISKKYYMGGEIPIPEDIRRAGLEAAGIEGGEFKGGDVRELDSVDVLSAEDREAAQLAADAAERAAKVQTLEAQRAEEAERRAEIEAAQKAIDEDAADTVTTDVGFGHGGAHSVIGKPQSGGVQPGQAGFGMGQAHRARQTPRAATKKPGFFKRLFGKSNTTRK